MNNKRWYPTCVTLATPTPLEVLVLSGYRNGTQLNVVPQVLNQTSLTWTTRANQPDSDEMQDYPWMHLVPMIPGMPDGRVFHAGARFRDCHYFNPAGGGSWPAGPMRIGQADRFAGMSVMYRPGKVIVIGGGPGGTPPTETVEVIDLTGATPAWQFAAPMTHRRRHLKATVSANGDVFVTGGTSAPGTPEDDDDPSGAVKAAERWRPPTGPGPGTWDLMASYHPESLNPTYRGYHSTALLLPDARILSGGGNPNPLVPSDHRRTMEIFWPPYLFEQNSDNLAPRPTIVTAPPTVTYGTPFEVEIASAHDIRQATFLRLGSVTHWIDTDQRFVDLGQPMSLGGNRWQVTPPANSMDAPAGYYVLFLINHLGVPSVAVSTTPALAILRLQS